VPILDKNNQSLVERYNAFIRKSEHGNITQDLNWSIVKKDWKNEQIYIEKNGEIVGAISLLIKPIIGKYHMIYGPRGPVCDVEDISLVKALCEAVDQVAKKYNGVMFRFDPEVAYSEALHEMYEANGFKVRNKAFGKNALIQPRYNMILDLKDFDEASLMLRFHKKTRYNIRLSARKGVTTRWGKSDEDIKTFYNLYNIMVDRNRIGQRPLEYFYDMREAYEDFRVYITEHEGEALSAAIGFNYHGKLWYAYGGSSNSKRNLMPNYLMQWEMIKWGLEVGGSQYDFGGVFTLDDSDGLFKFKSGFCHTDGVTEYIGEMDRVYNKTVYMMFEKMLPFAQSMKKKLGKLKKSIRGN